MKQNKKEIWFEAAEQPQNNQFMMQVADVFCNDWENRKYWSKVSRYYTHFRGDTGTMNFIRSEFDQNAAYLTQKMLKNPDWALGENKVFKQYSDKYYTCAKNLLIIDLKKISDQKLAKLLMSCKKYHYLSHGVAGSLTWQADADQERFTRSVIQMIEGQIDKKKLDLDGKAIFPILSTPAQESFINKEEKDLLKLAIRINENQKIKSVFENKKIEAIMNEIKQYDPKIHQMILDHHANYCWLYYQYQGPPAKINYYLERLQVLIKNNIDIEELLYKIINDKKAKIAEQKKLLYRLNFNKKQTKIIELSKYLIFMKDYRKAILFHGLYCSENILREIARRLYLSLEQIRTMNYDEIKDALLNKKPDVDELNERLKECIYYYEKDKYEIYTGKKLLNFLDKIEKEEFKDSKIKELKGTIACRGKIQGKVKVINIPEEMDKMNEGDIMVSRTTNPNLLPAMSKAGGLVSQDGGLTCHTAIVAREMNKPCLVGVKNVLRVLKDNDKIELDSEGGTIKIL